MMLHQDGSRHEWVPGCHWDLIVTLGDATSEILSGFFVKEEGTDSSFLGLSDVIERHGLPCSLYTDRGSHYFHTPEAGGKVDKSNPTQFGRALQQLGIEHIAAYSPEARGRSERAFGTLQDRLVKELAFEGIGDMEAANRYLQQIYISDHNRRFAIEPDHPGSAFVPVAGHAWKDVLSIQEERTVGNDNTVRFERLVLQLPAVPERAHFVRAKVRVHKYPDGCLAVFHGPRRLADYTPRGALITKEDDRNQNRKAA
jgi:hypothetical protein